MPGSVVVVGRFVNDRSAIRSDTAGPIYTIGAHDSVGMMACRKPAKHNHDGDCKLSHGLPPSLGSANVLSS